MFDAAVDRAPRLPRKTPPWPISSGIAIRSTAPPSSDALGTCGSAKCSRPPRAHWPNPFAERLFGSICQECLDHGLVLHEPHLCRMLTRYFAYYHRTRTHLALDKDASHARPIEGPEESPWPPDRVLARDSSILGSTACPNR